MDRHLQAATEAVITYAKKLDAVYLTSGREGLNDYSTTDVAALYWVKQREEGRITARIEAGQGRESDVLRKEQLAEQLEELHEYLWERGMERALER